MTRQYIVDFWKNSTSTSLLSVVGKVVVLLFWFEVPGVQWAAATQASGVVEIGVFSAP